MIVEPAAASFLVFLPSAVRPAGRGGLARPRIRETAVRGGPAAARVASALLLGLAALPALAALARADEVHLFSGDTKAGAPPLAAVPTPTAAAPAPAAVSTSAAPSGPAAGPGPSAALTEHVREVAADRAPRKERAARLEALGLPALELLLLEPTLAEDTEDLIPAILDGKTDEELQETALALLRGPERIRKAALPYLLRLPRAALVLPFLEHVAAPSEEGDIGERAALCARLGELCAQHGLSSVSLLLEQSAAVPPLRAAIAAVLGGSGRPEAIGMLARLVRDSDRGVRLAAIEALGEIDDGSGSQVPLLTALLAEGDPLAQKRAAVALGRLHALGAVDSLISLLDSRDRGLADDAHWALCEIAGRSLPPDAQAWRSFWQTERARAANELPPLLLELQSGEPAVIIEALRGAGGFVAGRQELRPALLALLSSEDPVVRAAACTTLGQLRDKGALPALVAALDDPDPLVWEAAWKALKRITGRNLPPRSALWRKPIK